MAPDEEKKETSRNGQKKWKKFQEQKKIILTHVWKVFQNGLKHPEMER